MRELKQGLELLSMGTYFLAQDCWLRPGSIVRLDREHLGGGRWDVSMNGWAIGSLQSEILKDPQGFAEVTPLSRNLQWYADLVQVGELLRKIKSLDDAGLCVMDSPLLERIAELSGQSAQLLDLLEELARLRS